MKCYWHSSDLDGVCSGAIVKHKYPTCEMIPINYGQEIDWDSIEPGEGVFVVDFSFPPEVMAALHERCELIYIDHHKTAIEKLPNYYEGLRRIGIGACALVWEYLYPLNPIPYAVELLSSWDVWRHENPDCKPFQYGMRVHTHDPADDVWYKILTDDRPTFGVMLHAGEAVVKYEEQSNAMRVKAAFDVEFEGLRCIACNQILTNSTLFDSVWDEDKYDAMIAFGWRKDKWTVSLYSTKVDVSKVALKYGGGGHAQACGFACTELPFKLGGN